jgi:hypothetical protein
MFFYAVISLLLDGSLKAILVAAVGAVVFTAFVGWMMKHDGSKSSETAGSTDIDYESNSGKGNNDAWRTYQMWHLILVYGVSIVLLLDALRIVSTP